MGNSSSAETAIEFHEPIQALLRDRGLKLSQKAISKLLQDIDGAAPWFAVSGSLTVPSWEKLGRDLTEHSKLGELSRCTLPLWRLIHSCLKGGGCEDIIQRGRKALSMCQDSASEGENVGTTVNRPKNPRRRKEKQAEKQGPAPRLYPLLDEFKALHLSQEELNPKEEAALEEAAAEYERGQYGSSPCARPPLYAPAAARASALVSLALFTINFLNVHDDDKTAAERHVALTHKEYSTVMWKDVLSNQWKGPDRVIARSRGSLCVSPQDQDPIWVPSRLTRSVEEKLERDAECRTGDATMDDRNVSSLAHGREPDLLGDQPDLASSHADALNKSRVIGRFLAGNWSREAERMILKRKIQILRLNATKLEPVTFGDFTSWLSSAFSFFKEWVGVATFAACCLFGIVLCLWLVCRIRVRARRDKVLLTQALLAIGEGDSPAAWLSALNNPR